MYEKHKEPRSFKRLKNVGMFGLGFARQNEEAYHHGEKASKR